MFGLFKKADKSQMERIDKLVDYFIFSLEGQSYIKEKLREHDKKEGVRLSPSALNKSSFIGMRDDLIKASSEAKTKSWNMCETYIFDYLKPALAAHEASFESDRERYEQIFGEKFHSGTVQKAKNKGWNAWK